MSKAFDAHFISACNQCYQQGRADKYKEITSEYMLLTEKQVAEIRTEAIEEFAKFLKSKLYWDDVHNFYSIPIYFIDEVVEQIKEQK